MLNLIDLAAVTAIGIATVLSEVSASAEAAPGNTTVCTRLLSGTDFNGHDGPGKPCGVGARSPAECCARCAAMSGCRTWTFIPGKGKVEGTCCFKTAATGRRAMPGYVSGCVEEAGKCPVPIPPNPAPPPPPPSPPPPPPPPPPCKSDEDCSLNGVCQSDGSCKCDPGWTSLPYDGPWCGFLDFLPSPTSVCGPACAFHGGEGGVDKRTTSWGGSVLPYRDCGLGAWTSNSQVVTAVSDTPLGPFVRHNVAIPPWSHNPEAIHTPDGKFVIFTLGPGKGKTVEKNCTSQADVPHVELSGTAHDTPPNRPPGPVNFTIHSADSPSGPWTATTLPVIGWTNLSWTLQTPGNWNPAPVVLPDGRVRVMAHTDWGPWAGEVILEAPTWRGPYKVVGGDEIDHCDYCEEDPFMWVDKRGHWHVLYHRMFDAYGPLDPNWGAEDGSWKKPKSPVPRGWAGGHAFSRDGLQWSKWNRCYNTSIPLSSGGFFETNRRERPKLLFDNNTGVPTHLYSGAITDKGTYTVVAPLNVPANRHERSNK